MSPYKRVRIESKDRIHFVVVDGETIFETDDLEVARVLRSRELLRLRFGI